MPVKTLLHELHGRRSSRIGQAVFALDRWLRRRQGSYEFSTRTRSDCLFRIEPRTADRRIVLSDGACACAGDPLIKLHLWNEHIPRMDRRGPTVGWARHISRAVDSSLAELAYAAARVASICRAARSTVATAARFDPPECGAACAACMSGVRSAASLRCNCYKAQGRVGRARHLGASFRKRAP